MKIMVLGLRGVVDIQGGIETHARHLYPLLARMGCRVQVLQRSPYFPGNRRRQWHGVSLKYLWSPTRPGLETALHSLLGVLYAIWKRPDILHLHAIGPALMTPLARLAGLRVVVTHHAEDYRREKWGSLAKSILRLGEWFGMRFANGRIVVSPVIGEGIKKRLGIDTDFIPNGAPRVMRTQTTDALRQFGLEPKKYVICVARVEPTKRQNDLIAAFQQAAPEGWKLAIVGALEDDAYTQEIRATAQDDDTISLTGFQKGRSLRELYSHAGLFVLPSSLEGLPIALLEALSYGIPVIASDIAENLTVPLPESCFFPVGNRTVLADRIRIVASGQDDQICWQDMPAMVKQHFSWRQAAQLTLSVYGRVIGKG